MVSVVDKDKCAFYEPSVEYLGHVLNGEGIKVKPSKVDAICNMPPPKDLQQLESFLGMSNYYSKFIKNFSTICAPLNQLRCKNTSFVWSSTHQEAFEKIKSALISTDVLVHYNPKLPLKLDCDASSFGLGAFLSHIMPDGSERPIHFASRSLTPAEKNWSQIDREACSIIFGIKKFFQFVYGRSFILVTDHKPLTTIFNPAKGLPSFMAARLQRWCTFLMQFQFQIMYRKTNDHANCDCLSRLPVHEISAIDSEEVLESELVEVHELSAKPFLDFKLVAQETKRDKMLKQLSFYIRSGFPSEIPPELKSYRNHEGSLSEKMGCIMLGSRVIIPLNLRSKVFVDFAS